MPFVVTFVTTNAPLLLHLATSWDEGVEARVALCCYICRDLHEPWRPRALARTSPGACQGRENELNFCHKCQARV
jgi:hypothetical protein